MQGIFSYFSVDLLTSLVLWQEFCEGEKQTRIIKCFPIPSYFCLHSGHKSFGLSVNADHPFSPHLKGSTLYQICMSDSQKIKLWSKSADNEVMKTPSHVLNSTVKPQMWLNKKACQKNVVKDQIASLVFDLIGAEFLSWGRPLPWTAINLSTYVTEIQRDAIYS